MFTADDIKQFAGTQSYYKCGPLVASDGVAFLINNDAHWLISDILAFRTTTPKLDLEFWELRVHPDKSADLRLQDGDYNYLFKHHYTSVDFPLQAIDIYVQNGVIFLASEY